MASRTTNLPFPDAVKELQDEYEISGREILRRTRAKGWGSSGTISFLLRGEQPPTMRSIEAVAEALQVRPEYFAEYRLAKARAALDPKIVGLDNALKYGVKAAEKALAGK